MECPKIISRTIIITKKPKYTIETTDKMSDGTIRKYSGVEEYNMPFCENTKITRIINETAPKNVIDGANFGDITFDSDGNITFS